MFVKQFGRSSFCYDNLHFKVAGCIAFVAIGALLSLIIEIVIFSCQYETRGARLVQLPSKPPASSSPDS